eukprot:12301326-Heterocapsa_arctica.AAC.1
MNLGGPYCRIQMCAVARRMSYGLRLSTNCSCESLIAKSTRWRAARSSRKRMSNLMPSLKCVVS